MSRKLKFKLNDDVVVKVIEGSNASSYICSMTLDNIDDWVLKGTVTKIGRKYITVKFNRKFKSGDYSTEEQFSIEDNYKQKYTAGGVDFQLYSSKQEVLDDIESEKIFDKIRHNFGSWRNSNKFTLDQLKRIEEIIDENIDDEE